MGRKCVHMCPSVCVCVCRGRKTSARGVWLHETQLNWEFALFFFQPLNLSESEIGRVTFQQVRVTGNP